MIKGTPGGTPQEVKNGQFLSRSDKWTHNTKWVWSNTLKAMVHVSGDIEALTQDLPNITKDTIAYEAKYTVMGAGVGSLTVKYGSGDSGTTITTNGSYSELVSFTTDNVLSFTPTTDFVGYVTGVSVRQLKVQP